MNESISPAGHITVDAFSLKRRIAMAIGNIKAPFLLFPEKKKKRERRFLFLVRACTLAGPALSAGATLLLAFPGRGFSPVRGLFFSLGGTEQKKRRR